MTKYVPGDILLVNDYSGHGDLIGNLILAGGEARYRKRLWTHSAIIVSEDGDLVEAMQDGVDLGHVNEYADKKTYVVHFPAPANDPRRLYAVAFARAQVGERYAVLGFISLAVDLLFNLKLGVHIEREPVCSELASRATESMTDDGWQFSPPLMMPIDIYAWHFKLPLNPLPLYKRWLTLFQALYWSLAPWKTGLRP